MKYALAIIASSLIMGGTVLTGCDQGGSGTQAHGLLASAGFANASDVSFVVLQPGDVFKVTDATTVGQLYNAVNQPDRDFVSKMARNRLLAFVGNGGSTAYVVYSDGGDLTAHQGSSKLMPLVRQVYRNPAYKDATHIPTGGLSEVRVIGSGKTTVASQKSGQRWKPAQASAVSLIELWNPNDLHGCRRVTKNEVDALSSRYVEMRFARPTSFKTFIVPKDFEWWSPPESVESRVKYEDVRSNLVRVASVQPGQMRLAFEIGSGGTWVLSPALSTKKFLGYTPQGQARFGADLFEEVVSTLTKS
ncbi:MAG: hypothetical protein ACUVRS_10395 [Armatimonadota bacterium]